MSNANWTPVCRVEEVSPDSAAAVLHDDTQIAIFRLINPERWIATQNRCPHWNEMVLSRGLIGEADGEPKVACPMHKRQYSLTDGRCLNMESESIHLIEVEIIDGMVCLPTQLPASLMEGERRCAQQSRVLVERWERRDQESQPKSKTAVG